MRTLRYDGMMTTESADPTTRQRMDIGALTLYKAGVGTTHVVNRVCVPAR
jgi:hypothetical protein